jgi:hypothetical protein
MAKSKNAPERLFTIPIAEVMPIIGRSLVEVRGVAVSANTESLKTFKKRGPKCWLCGLEGEFFAAEKQRDQEVVHIKLYGKQGKKEVMLTKDHVIPKSWGGRDTMKNYRVLCSVCNNQLGKFYQMMKEFVIKTMKKNELNVSHDAVCQLLAPIASSTLHRLERAIRTLSSTLMVDEGPEHGWETVE